MLLALIFRGVAFEFRWRDPRHRPFWDFAFTGGSVVAAFAQGITLGALLQGIAVKDRAYAGGWWDWLTPFSLLVGASLVCGYALLGATWLILKSEGTLQARCYRLAVGLGIGTLVAIGAVSVATPFLSDVYWQRWFAWPQRPVHRRGAAAGRRCHLRVLRQPQAPPHLHAVPDGAAGVRAEPAPASASACSPTSCRPRSRSGMPPRRRRA